MQIKRPILVIAILTYAVAALTGCTVRTYSLTRDRVDQDLTGNRGYIQGTAPAEIKERKATRTTQVIEFELLSPRELKRTKKKAVEPEGVLVPEVPRVEPKVREIEPISAITPKIEKYKVKEADTLQKISQAFYGTTKKWTKIYEANKDVLSSPNKIYPGQIINIPIEELKEPKENLK